MSWSLVLRAQIFLALRNILRGSCLAPEVGTILSLSFKGLGNSRVFGGSGTKSESSGFENAHSSFLETASRSGFPFLEDNSGGPEQVYSLLQMGHYHWSHYMRREEQPQRETIHDGAERRGVDEGRSLLEVAAGDDRMNSPLREVPRWTCFFVCVLYVVYFLLTCTRGIFSELHYINWSSRRRKDEGAVSGGGAASNPAGAAEGAELYDTSEHAAASFSPSDAENLNSSALGQDLPSLLYDTGFENYYSYWMVRTLVTRFQAICYFAGFVDSAFQNRAIFGEDGLQPLWGPQSPQASGESRGFGTNAYEYESVFFRNGHVIVVLRTGSIGMKSDHFRFIFHAIVINIA